MTKRLLCTFMLTLCVLLLCGLSVTAQDNSSAMPIVNHASSFAVSAPLREIAKLPQAPQYGFHEVNPIHRIPMKDFGHAVDPVEQSTAGPAANYPIGLDFLGVGNGFPGYSVPDAPPDTNRAFGNTEVVQGVTYRMRCSTSPPAPR